MNLDFNKAVETKVDVNRVTKLKPGVHDNVLITGLSDITPQSGSPYIELTLVAEDGSGQHKEKLYMSPAAEPYSSAKIKELLIATKTSVPNGANVEEVSSMLEGKKVAIRLNGEEVVIQSGEDKGKAVIIAKLSQNPFCAPSGLAGSLKFSTSNIKLLDKKEEQTIPDGLPF